ncbi:MAG: FAD-binding oxidoreductase [Bryobacteraceae bacterium]|nr:FAD-binding oxidoreductase [Bryobacteraceae bacterium]MDW8379510.1 FAD-binding oxidoreductase [Bryobacterales bacterium]
MNLSEYDISNPYPATLIKTERITPEDSKVEVRHLVLELPEGDFHFVEGQSIGVLAPGPHEFGNKHHLRLYSIASPRKGEAGKPNTFSLCVRRCFYIDEISGEMYPGKASNYLCDAKPGDVVQITGPYGAHFSVPADSKSNLLMVGVGTGIAPFRAFVRHIYEERGGWEGRVRLFYGAKTGTELLYMNDKVKDFTLYYDEKTFKAFEAVSPRPAFDLPPDVDRLLLDNRQEVWSLIQDPNTYVYVAGLQDVAEKFEKAMITMAGSEEAWRKLRTELVAQGRYSELLY